MRGWAAEHPEDETFVWREYSAAGFEDHPVDCRHCWQLANPALGDFLSERIIASFLPPKTREATFRRARLCQFAEELADPWLPPWAWADCADERPVPDGAEVVLALDGSFSQDATALVVAEIGEVPHLGQPRHPRLQGAQAQRPPDRPRRVRDHGALGRRDHRPGRAALLV